MQVAQTQLSQEYRVYTQSLRLGLVVNLVVHTCLFTMPCSSCHNMMSHAIHMQICQIILLFLPSALKGARCTTYLIALLPFLAR